MDVETQVAKKSLGATIEQWLADVCSIVFKFPYTYFVLVFKPSLVQSTLDKDTQEKLPIMRPYSFVFLNHGIFAIIFLSGMDSSTQLSLNYISERVQDVFLGTGRFSLIDVLALTLPSLLITTAFAVVVSKISSFYALVHWKILLYYSCVFPLVFLVAFAFFYSYLYFGLDQQTFTLLGISVFLVGQIPWVLVVLCHHKGNARRQKWGALITSALALPVGVVLYVYTTYSWHDFWAQRLAVEYPDVFISDDGDLEFEFDLQSNFHRKITLENSAFYLITSYNYGKGNYYQAVKSYDPKLFLRGTEIDRLNMYPDAANKVTLKVSDFCDSIADFVESLTPQSRYSVYAAIELENAKNIKIHPSEGMFRSSLFSQVKKTCVPLTESSESN